ncbi:hypothetical protein FQA39_LY14660 [Lamprigera yunnana]|nr:hypothetical protein FQA39_LY14660 [Lamprigera yunnana]
MKKKKKQQIKDPTKLTAVDRKFYQLTVIDLKKKQDRKISEYFNIKEQHETLEIKMKEVDEETTSEINQLKRILSQKEEEMAKCEKTLARVQKEREEQLRASKKQIKECEKEYVTVHTQLTSDFKLLKGRSSSLNEFRTQKERLLQKLEERKKFIQEKEANHKRSLYETERLFYVGIDKLKQEMEMKLVQLSCDFQQVTQKRVAASTHRIIRENIAVNNEINRILITNRRLHDENKNLTKTNAVLKVEKKNLILKLKTDRDLLLRELETYKNIEADSLVVSRELKRSQLEKENMERVVRILEQNMHNSMCDRSTIKTQLDYVKSKYDKILTFLNESAILLAFVLNEALPKQVKNTKMIKLLKKLLSITLSFEEKSPTRQSLASVESLSEMYEKGDLGLDLELVELRSVFPIQENKRIQMGLSFEEFLETHIPSKKEEEESKTEGEEEEEEAFVHVKELSEVEEEESEVDLLESTKESIVFGETSSLSSLSISVESEPAFDELFEFLDPSQIGITKGDEEEKTEEEEEEKEEEEQEQEMEEEENFVIID